MPPTWLCPALTTTICGRRKMACPWEDVCGGCTFRSYSEADYREHKQRELRRILETLPVGRLNFGPPVFVGDGARRRATFAFSVRRGDLVLGFNRRRSEELVNLASCPLLVPEINAALPEIRRLIAELCKIPQPLPKNSKKHKKNLPVRIGQGDVAVCAADNGLDLVLEFDAELGLEHKMAVFEWSENNSSVIRISHRRKAFGAVEPLIEKAKPQIAVGGSCVYIPAGTFLQASSAGERALTGLVLQYLGGTRGKIADLFCGVGTFSYPLAALKGNKILAVDSSRELLEGFRNSINRNMLANIEIWERNLFKYPLAGKELSGFDVLVFDPPRAGAAAQMEAVAALPPAGRPQKIIAVSCNPHSFVKDAGILLACGYELRETTLVDQFAYSNHSELVALFTLNS